MQNKGCCTSKNKCLVSSYLWSCLIDKFDNTKKESIWLVK